MGLWAQGQLSRALIPCSYLFAIAWMKLGRHYRIPAIRRARREFKRLRGENRGPLVICGNHLTAVDSLLIMWALSPGWRAFLRPSLMPWNLPDKANFSGNLALRVLCYVGRCLPIMRKGPREEVRRVLDKVKALLQGGDSILIFPEGGRSRTGRVDTENFSYGVGTILQECPEAKVLCVFFRGKQQTDFSTLPHRGDEFHINLRLIAPRSASEGLRGARDVSTQIVRELAAMETEYFAHEATHEGC
jgi:1-acyl-sn-glycerol-3-phosphate acyltransferase